MATTVNFSGLGSNIDFGLIRDAIIADRMQPVTQLQTRSASLGTRSSALKQLNGLLANLTSATTALTSNSQGTGRSSISSDSSIVSASASPAAGTGSINLNISRLATNLTQATTSFPSTSTGILAGGATTATFELRTGGATTGTLITIDATNNSLAGLRDAINNAGTGVTASIVDINGNGTQNQLVLTSNATGAAGRVELVETSATGTDAALNLRSLNPPGAVADFSALDAQLSINGLTITRSTNTISDALSGVTFNLNKVGLATINVQPASDIADNLQTFIDAYNRVQRFISTQYQQDSDGKATGVLAGDSTLRMIQGQLRDAVNSISTGNGGTLSNLSDLGINRDKDGNLTLDTAALDTKLQRNLGDVKSLLFGSGGNKGLFNSLNTSFSGLSDDVTGVVQTAINGYQTSIKTLNSSIADQTQRINALKDSLTQQFAKVDAAINLINGQGSTLTSIIDALKPRTS
jgi:flagellar hook-associated protein 2